MFRAFFPSLLFFSPNFFFIPKNYVKVYVCFDDSTSKLERIIGDFESERGREVAAAGRRAHVNELCLRFFEA